MDKSLSQKSIGFDTLNSNSMTISNGYSLIDSKQAQLNVKKVQVNLGVAGNN